MMPRLALVSKSRRSNQTLRRKTRWRAGSALTEVLFGAPMTAHIMSGVAMGTDASNGVVDSSGEVFGYQNLRVIDGSIIPGNLG